MPEKAHTSFRPDKHSTSHLHSLQSSGYTDYPENLLQPSSTNALESANNPPRNSEAPLHEHTHYFNSRYHVGSDVSTSEGLIAESSGYFDDSGGNNFPSLINERSFTGSVPRLAVGEESFQPSNTKYNFDPGPCLADTVYECYCVACESRKSGLITSTFAEPELRRRYHHPPNTGANAVNEFHASTAGELAEPPQRNSNPNFNNDYSSDNLTGSISRPSQIHQYPYKRTFGLPEGQGVSYTETDSYQNTFSHNLLSPHTHSSWNSNTLDSIDRPTYFEGLATIIGNPPSSTIPISQLDHSMTNQGRPQVRQKRGRRKVMTSTVKPSQSDQPFVLSTMPTYSQFIKAQKYLDVALEGATEISALQKDYFASILEISVPEFETCIETRNIIRPIIRELVSAADRLKLPADHVTLWYREAHSQKPSTDATNDSAYQSKLNISQEIGRPTKRQKKVPEEHLKPYQCTSMLPRGSYCSQVSKDHTDWKRHEEIHYPRRRWVCLIQGSHGGASCHVCFRNIDLVGAASTLTHTACLTRGARNGHYFQRKDKLLAHVRSDHECQASCDTWYQDVLSPWKTQCGFCGDTFLDWDARCNHVGLHFLDGKKMDPDWKDPWPDDSGNFGQGPDDDEDGDYNDDHRDDEDHGLSDKTGNGDEPPGDKPGGSDSRGRQPRSGNAPPQDHTAHEGTSRSSRKRGQSEKEKTCRRENTDASPASHVEHQLEIHSISPGAGSALRFVRKVGSGAFGIVDEIVHSQSNTSLARKTIRVNIRNPSVALTQVRKEVAALRQLTHGHIVKALASFAEKTQFSVILSPLASCNLAEFMRIHALPATTQRTLLSQWFACLASALAFIHEKYWLHMDLKPQNILISGNRVLVSDFGSARRMSDGVKGETARMSSAITPMYCAPELVAREATQAITPASDIYSLGCIYLEMATVLHRQCILVFENLRGLSGGDKSFHSNTLKSKVWIERLWDICTVAVPTSRAHEYQVMRNMLSVDMIRRPSANMLKKLYSEQYNFGAEDGPDEHGYYAVKHTDQPFDPFEIASSWLRTCQTYHKECSVPAMDFFPSRILDVGDEGDTIRLQSSLQLFDSQYVALSHCWGSTTTVLKTTSDNLKDRHLGIENSSLPDKFQNAVRLTRALGVKYLWIDSLCIIQDSIEDWTEVSSQLHKLYSNSLLTISILDEDHRGPELTQDADTAGLTAWQPPNQCSTCKCKHRAFAHLLDDTPGTMILDSKLSKRAWTFQERLLAPRVLHFSSTRLAWECGSVTSIHDITATLRSSMGIGRIVRLSEISVHEKICFRGAKSPSTAKYLELWPDIVREYSKRQLTYSSDKLYALAGLATTVNNVVGSQYLAGLWNNDLKRNLLWFRDFSTPPSTRPRYIAPSWSWASIDSQVMWPKSIMELVDDYTSEISSCSTTLTSTISPFGGVVDGYLKIRGPVCKAAVNYPYLEELLDGTSLRPFAFVQFDALIPAANLSYKWNSNGSWIEKLWCLQLLQGAGLVLQQRRGGFQEIFERVGVYWFDVENDTEGDVQLLWEEKTITIV